MSGALGDGLLCDCLNLKNMGMERALFGSSLIEMEKQEYLVPQANRTSKVF